MLQQKIKKRLKELVKRELYHYKPVATLCNDLIDNLYALAEAIDDKREITITYYKMDKSRIDRKIRPLAIVFSEYYFYLIAVHETDGKWKDRYYRVDRITDMVKHRTHFEVEYDSRFDEGKLKMKFSICGRARISRLSLNLQDLLYRLF